MTETAKLLMDKYGHVLMTVEDLSDLLAVPTKSITNKVSAGTFPIHTFKIGKYRKARLNDVARYIDGL